MQMNTQELVQRYKAGERDFSVTELFGADLHGAELSGAVLHGAELREADLSGADLSEVNLDWAILERANLSGATLLDANLPGANPTGADLYGANLKEAIMPDGTVHKRDTPNMPVAGRDKNGASRCAPLRAVAGGGQEFAHQCLELDRRLRILPWEETLLAAKDARISPSDGIAKALSYAIVQMELEHVWRGHTGLGTQLEGRPPPPRGRQPRRIPWHHPTR
jgi:hypothetical protein